MEQQTQNFIKILNTTFTSEVHSLENPDWDALYKMARAQSVTPLFNEGASRYSEFAAAPAELRQQLFQQSLMILASQAQRTEEFLESYEALLEAGIKPLVVKGIICRRTYGGLADHRPSGDEDIYVKKEDFEVCRRVLVSLGYDMEELEINESFLDKAQEISFFSPSGLAIEVHINLFGKETETRRRLNRYFDNAFENAVAFEADDEGRAVYTMEPTANYLFLFLHLYKHFTTSGVGIRQIMDMAMFDKAFHRQINFEAVEEAIKEMKADKLYADVLAIGGMLGLSLATPISGYNPEKLLEDMMESGVFGLSTEEHSYSRYVTMMAMDGEHNGKVSLLRSVFPPASVLLSGYPVLERRPWLLPVVWLERCFRFVFRRNSANVGGESLKIGRKRVELMREYGMIK